MFRWNAHINWIKCEKVVKLNMRKNTTESLWDAENCWGKKLFLFFFVDKVLKFSLFVLGFAFRPRAFTVNNKPQLQTAYFTYTLFLTATYVSKNVIWEKFILSLRCNIFMVDWNEVQTREKTRKRDAKMQLNLHLSNKTRPSRCYLQLVCSTWAREITKSFIKSVRAFESISHSF